MPFGGSNQPEIDVRLMSSLASNSDSNYRWASAKVRTIGLTIQLNPGWSVLHVRFRNDGRTACQEKRVIWSLHRLLHHHQVSMSVTVEHFDADLCWNLLLDEVVMLLMPGRSHCSCLLNRYGLMLLHFFRGNAVCTNRKIHTFGDKLGGKLLY